MSKRPWKRWSAGWGPVGRQGRPAPGPGGQLQGLEDVHGWLASQRPGPASLWGLGPGGRTGEAITARVAACEQQLRALPRRVRRALQRSFALPLAEVALLLALGQGPAWAATINVTVSCTLVKAIEAANTDSTAGGVCTKGSGADTIVLPAGSTQTLTSVNNTTLGQPTGLPVVTSTITLAGQGSIIQRASSATTPTFGLLAVGPSGQLTLQNLTLRRGRASSRGGGVYNQGTLILTNSTLSGNSIDVIYGSGSGGGVYNQGTLILTNSTISGNSAGIGGGIDNAGTVTLTSSTLSGNTASYDGGGMANTGTAILTNSTLSGNTATSAIHLASGGGISNGGVLTLLNSTLSGNGAHDFGGAISNGGTVTLVNSTLSGNRAAYGGGVDNDGILTLTNSTLSGNSAVSFSSSDSYGRGGGVSNQGTVTLTNSTLSGNSAYDSGGGIDNTGTVTLTNGTLSGNSANAGGGVYNVGTLTLARTLISGNTFSPAQAPLSGPELDNAAGSVTASNFNLFGFSNDAGVVGFVPVASEVPSVPLNSILSPTLAFNGGPHTGGPTRTRALVSGSPAVNAVTAGGCPATDQRGFVRNVGACDIGAFELGASAPPLVNNLVSFATLPATFSTITNTTGCGAGFAGKLFFQARLTNKSGSPSLTALKASVVTLSNNNKLQTADGGLGSVGAQQTLPQASALAPTKTLDVPFVICLTDLQQVFHFGVNILGYTP